MSASPPPRAVLRAFGVDVGPRPLAGGRGTSWIAGPLVLKPESGPTVDWLGEALLEVAPDGLRLVGPVRTRDGAWSSEGWSATRRVGGSEPDYSRESTWIEILEVGRALHRAVAHLSRPACLGARQDWWALADRAAWGERPIRFRDAFAPTARRLEGALEPLGPSQVVHADLTRNVLFSAGTVPAVIDFSPLWRPPAYADGVVVADALCWSGAHPSLLELGGVSVGAVARALVFRMATTNERIAAGVDGVDLEDEAQRYSRAAAVLGL